jgi:PhnB protein
LYLFSDKDESYKNLKSKEYIMKAKPVPQGFHTVTPYLVVQGADKVIEFIKKAFNGEERYRMKNPDGSIMHAEVKIGDSIVMLSDATEHQKAMPATLHLYIEDIDATYQRALKAGGISTMEPADQFYGDRSGGVKDSAGNNWWIATHIEDITEEEMQVREQEFIKQRR